MPKLVVARQLGGGEFQREVKKTKVPVPTLLAGKGHGIDRIANAMYRTVNR